MGGVEQVLAFAFLAADVITYAVVIILMSRLDVEKHIEEDQRAVFYEKYQQYGNSEGEWKYCEAQADAAGFHIREILRNG